MAAVAPLRDKQRIVVGQPLPFSVLGADGKLLLAQGQVVTDRMRDMLLRAGAFQTLPDSPRAPLESSSASHDMIASDPLVLFARDYAVLLERYRFAISIAPHENGESYASQVIGVVRDKRQLILNAPVRLDGSLVAIAKGQPWVCRLFNATSVFRFNAHVVKVAFEPFPHLHLEIAAAIERRAVRVRPRAIVAVPAVLSGTSEIRGIIVDLSLGGARIGLSGKTDYAVGTALSMNFSVRVLGHDCPCALMAHVTADYGCSDKSHPDVHFIGVRFDAVPQDQLMPLHAYIQEQLAREADRLSHLLGIEDGDAA